MTTPRPRAAVRRKLAAAAACAAVSSPLAAQQWVDWTTKTPGDVPFGVVSGTVAGAVTFGATSVGALFTGEFGASNNSTQVNGGSRDPWSFLPDLYTSPANGLPNRPPGRDVIALGDGASLQRVTFATAVVDPVMAIYAMGPPDEALRPQTVVFDTPFEVLNSRQVPRGFPERDVPSLVNLGLVGGGYVLRGDAGFGLIRFTGTHTTISWTLTTTGERDGFDFTIGAVAVAPQQVIPEPATVALVGAGGAVLALGAGRRARRRAG
jgi:hypothetical protein